MEHIPRAYLLSKKPKEYLKQGFTHCGAYSVKAILSAYGVDDSAHPTDLYLDGWARILGAGIGKNYWTRVLRAHGIYAENKSAVTYSDEEKIILLKRLLVRDTPVMIRIGNGYATDKYNPVLGKIFGHWITL